MHEGQALDGTKVSTRFHKLMGLYHKDIKAKLVLPYTVTDPPLVVPVCVDRRCPVCVQERHEGDDDEELEGVVEYWKCLADLANAQENFEVLCTSPGRFPRRWFRVVCSPNVCLCVYDVGRVRSNGGGQG